MDHDNTRERKLDRLKTLLGAFGSDPCQWPEEEQRRLGDLFSLGAEADAMREEARILDELLLTAKPVAPPSPDLAARIVMSATQHDQMPASQPVEAAPVFTQDEKQDAAPGLAGRIKAALDGLWSRLSPGRTLAPAAGVMAMLVITILVANPDYVRDIGSNPQVSPSVTDVAFDPMMNDPLDDMIIEISVMSEDPLVFDMDL
ncbi:MAG: hypothetical protein Alpg2KO_25710 [Alphaproteobacteria bacterium]